MFFAAADKKPSRRQNRRPVVLIHEGAPGFGGSVTSLAALVPELEAAGFDVRIASAREEGWDRLGLIDKTDFIRAQHWDAYHGPRFFGREALRSRELRAIASKHRASLVMGNNTPMTNLASYWAAGSLNLPMIQYIRGAFFPSRLDRWALSRARAIFLVGDEAERLVQSMHLENQPPTMQVKEGLSESQWPSPRKSDAKDWLWASALAAWKGLPMLTSAYEELQSQKWALPPLQVCYAGFERADGDAGALPKRVPPGVTLRHDPPDLDGIRAGCRVYFHTSLRPEPFGRSILEAMAAGLCPVVPDEGGGALLVVHKKNGLLYPARSKEGLKEAMRTLIMNPDIADRLGRAAAQSAEAYKASRAFRPVTETLSSIGRMNRWG